MVAAGVVTAMVGLTLAAVLPNGASEQDATTTTTMKLGADAQELLRLLDKRDEATYHARYQASTAEADGLVIETWQAPPRVRQDSEVRSGGQVVKTRVLLTPAGRVRCARLNDAEWNCRPAAGDETLDPLASFRRRLSQGEVTGRDTSVDGRATRCFELKTAEGASELCLLPDTGIPARVRGGQTQLRLMLLDEKVTPDLFEPPAPVAG